MNPWQIKFFKRRQMTARDLNIQLAKLDDKQVDAVLRVAQRVIDGRCAILACSSHLSTEEIHVQRGAIAGMQDFIDFFERSVAEVRNEHAAGD